MKLLGVVLAPLASVYPYWGRDHSSENISTLSEKLENPTSHHTATQNLAVDDVTAETFRIEDSLIEVVVVENDLPQILNKLGLTRAQLASTNSLPISSDGSRYPLLDQPLALLQGRQRVAAGKELNFTAWPAKLFCVKGKWEHFPTKIRCDKAEDQRLLLSRFERPSRNELPYSDGTIYGNLIEAKQEKDTAREESLREEKSQGKILV